MFKKAFGARLRGCMYQKPLLLSAMALVVLCSSPALADNIHLCDINQGTQCNAGSAIPISAGTTQAWAFGTANNNETLHIAALSPQGTGASTYNGIATSTNLWTALGVKPAQNFPNFSSAQSQEQLATGIVASSFNVTSFTVGTWTGSVTIGESVKLPSAAVGTIFIAYLLDSTGNLVAVSPWSSDLIVASTPEPSSLALLGSGCWGSWCSAGSQGAS